MTINQTMQTEDQKRQELYTKFVKAYNDFELRPLDSSNLSSFFVSDFVQDSIKSVTTTIRITERFKKMLIIGHTGCGKSTMLQQIANELSDTYRVISFRVSDVLNLQDINALDILLAIYIQLVKFIKDSNILDRKFTDKVLNNFTIIMEPVSEVLSWGV